MKKFILKWLGLTKELDNQIAINSILKNKINELEEWQKIINSLLDIGLDHHLNNDSWAVVCLKGKPEYIKFYNLSNMNIREIQKFLSNFEGGNYIVDSPFREDFWKL